MEVAASVQIRRGEARCSGEVKVLVSEQQGDNLFGRHLLPGTPGLAQNDC